MTLAEAMAVAAQNQCHPVDHVAACEALSVLRLVALSLEAPEWFDIDVAAKALATQWNDGNGFSLIPRAEIEKLAVKFGHDQAAVVKRYAPWMRDGGTKE